MTVSRDDAAFLRTIIAEPASDAPRLIYADYLDEQGEADRARFIRVAIANGDDNAQGEFGAVNAPVRPGEEWSLWGLFPGCVVTCYEPLYLTRSEVMRTSRGPVASALTRRGFVERLTIDAASWFAHAATLTAATPLREVELTTTPEWDGILQKLEDKLASMSVTEVRQFRKKWSPIWGEAAGVSVSRVDALQALWPGIRFTLPTGYLRPGTLAERIAEDIRSGRAVSLPNERLTFPVGDQR